MTTLGSDPVSLLREGHIKTKVLSNNSFLLAHDELDLRGLEQLVDREQVAALAQVLRYMELKVIIGEIKYPRSIELQPLLPGVFYS